MQKKNIIGTSLLMGSLLAAGSAWPVEKSSLTIPAGSALARAFVPLSLP